MNNQRLTLIRRATNAIETAMQRIAFSEPVLMDSLKSARRHLRAAKFFQLQGVDEFAKIEMHNACTHMQIVLGVAL